jgi:hypothetical protein
MKLTLSTYKGKFWALCVAAVLVVALLWQKRMSASVERWRSHRELSAQVTERSSTADQLAMLRATSIGLQASLGDIDASADITWQAVLTAIGNGPSDGARLHRLEAEMLSSEAGTELHVLPVTLSGTYQALMRTANEVQRAVPEAHVISMRFHTERAGYGRSRDLLLTLYFQKIVRHA